MQDLMPQFSKLAKLIETSADIASIKAAVNNLKQLQHGQDLLAYGRIETSHWHLIFLACQLYKRNLDVITVLLDEGALQHLHSKYQSPQISSEDSEFCPIHLAIAKKDSPLIRVLVNHPSFGDFSRYLIEGKTLAQLCLINYPPALKILYDIFGIKFLEQEINGFNAYTTALYMAVVKKQPEYLNFILKNLKISYKIYDSLDYLIALYSNNEGYQEKFRILKEQIEIEFNKSNSYIRILQGIPKTLAIDSPICPEEDSPDSPKFQWTYHFHEEHLAFLSHREFLTVDTIDKNKIKVTSSKNASKKRKALSHQECDTEVYLKSSDPGTEVYVCGELASTAEKLYQDSPFYFKSPPNSPGNPAIEDTENGIKSSM